MVPRRATAERLEEQVVRALGVNIVRLRKQAGMTQAELASLAGTTVETVARLERVLRGRSSANGNPSLATIVRISNALGVGVSELIGQQPFATPADHASWRLREAARLEREAVRLRSGSL